MNKQNAELKLRMEEFEKELMKKDNLLFAVAMAGLGLLTGISAGIIGAVAFDRHRTSKIISENNELIERRWPETCAKLKPGHMMDAVRIVIDADESKLVMTQRVMRDLKGNLHTGCTLGDANDLLDYLKENVEK